MAGVRRGAFTCVGWQETLCDSIWQVTSSSSEMGFPWKAMSASTFLPFLQQFYFEVAMLLSASWLIDWLIDWLIGWLYSLRRWLSCRWVAVAWRPWMEEASPSAPEYSDKDSSLLLVLIMFSSASFRPSRWGFYSDSKVRWRRSWTSWFL